MNEKLNYIITPIMGPPNPRDVDGLCPIGRQLMALLEEQYSKLIPNFKELLNCTQNTTNKTQGWRQRNENSNNVCSVTGINYNTQSMAETKDGRGIENDLDVSKTLNEHNATVLQNLARDYDITFDIDEDSANVEKGSESNKKIKYKELKAQSSKKTNKKGNMKNLGFNGKKEINKKMIDVQKWVHNTKVEEFSISDITFDFLDDDIELSCTDDNQSNKATEKRDLFNKHNTIEIDNRNINIAEHKNLNSTITSTTNFNQQNNVFQQSNTLISRVGEIKSKFGLSQFKFVPQVNDEIDEANLNVSNNKIIANITEKHNSCENADVSALLEQISNEKNTYAVSDTSQNTYDITFASEGYIETNQKRTSTDIPMVTYVVEETPLSQQNKSFTCFAKRFIENYEKGNSNTSNTNIFKSSSDVFNLKSNKMKTSFATELVQKDNQLNSTNIVESTQNKIIESEMNKIPIKPKQKKKFNLSQFKFVPRPENIEHQENAAEGEEIVSLNNKISKSSVDSNGKDIYRNENEKPDELVKSSSSTVFQPLEDRINQDITFNTVENTQKSISSNKCNDEEKYVVEETPISKQNKSLTCFSKSYLDAFHIKEASYSKQIWKRNLEQLVDEEPPNKKNKDDISHIQSKAFFSKNANEVSKENIFQNRDKNLELLLIENFNSNGESDEIVKRHTESNFKYNHTFLNTNDESDKPNVEKNRTGSKNVLIARNEEQNEDIENFEKSTILNNSSNSNLNDVSINPSLGKNKDDQLETNTLSTFTNFNNLDKHINNNVFRSNISVEKSNSETGDKNNHNSTLKNIFSSNNSVKSVTEDNCNLIEFDSDDFLEDWLHLDDNLESNNTLLKSNESTDKNNSRKSNDTSKTNNGTEQKCIGEDAIFFEGEVSNNLSGFDSDECLEDWFRMDDEQFNKVKDLLDFDFSKNDNPSITEQNIKCETAAKPNNDLTENKRNIQLKKRNGYILEIDKSKKGPPPKTKQTKITSLLKPVAGKTDSFVRKTNDRKTTEVQYVPPKNWECSEPKKRKITDHFSVTKKTVDAKVHNDENRTEIEKTDGQISKYKKSKFKFFTPLLSQLEEKFVQYQIYTLDDNMCGQLEIYLIENRPTQIAFDIINKDGSSLLNHPKSVSLNKSSQTGVMISISWETEKINKRTFTEFYYMQLLNTYWRCFLKPKSLLKVCLTTDCEKICYKASIFFSLLLEVFSFSSREICCIILDPHIGCWLLDPDHPPNTFQGVQSQLNIRPNYKTRSNDALEISCDMLLQLSEAMQHVKQVLEEKHLWIVFHDIEMKVVSILAAMEHHGISVNKNELDHLATILKEKLQIIEKKAYQVAGRPFQINSTVQLRTILYDELKLDVKNNVYIKQTAALGAKSTSEPMLKLLRHLHALPGLILEYRHLYKAKSTFVDSIIQHIKSGCIYSTWTQTSTATGRIAAHNPNLQAIPKHPFPLILYPEADIDETINLRSPYNARSGYTLVAADFQHIELRVFAHLSQDTKIIEALNEPGDIFVTLTRIWLGNKNEEITKERREKTKRLVYAILYGAGSNKLADVLSVPLEEATRIIRNFSTQFPTLREFSRETIEKCRIQGYLISLSGRRRLFPNINSSDFGIRSQSERQAVNFIIQGSAADICKAAMISTTQQLKYFNCRLLLQIHDELVWEVLDEDLENVKDVIKNVMENITSKYGGFKLSVPFPVVITSGKNWSKLI